MQISENNILNNLLDSDIINSSEVLNVIDHMKKQNELKKKYQDKIKRRADGKQYYVYIKRKQYSAKTEEQLYEVLFNLEYGKEQWSMSDIFPMWLRWKRDYTPVSGRTLKNISGEWKNFIEPHEIADIPMKELNAKDFVRLFRGWTCKRDMTLKKFNNLKSLINGIYSYAINEAEIVSVNPIREIDRKQFSFKVVNNDDDVFSIEDREKLLDHLADNDDIFSLAIQFDFHVTLRIGELLSLKWENIRGNKIYVDSQLLLTTKMDDDLKFSKYRLETVDHVKGYAEQGYRYIPLTPKAQEILERVKLQNPDGKYIFMRNGRQIYTARFNEHLVKYCNEIGIEPRTSHKIRFTVASLLYLNGMPLQDLQRLLGHTSLQMTLHYIRNVTNTETASNLMEKCLG
jgi:integrase